MMFLWIPFLILIPLAVYWAFRSEPGTGGCAVHHAAQAHTTPQGGPSRVGGEPIEIARQRLARGEISTEQYEEIRRLLG